MLLFFLTSILVGVGLYYLSPKYSFKRLILVLISSIFILGVNYSSFVVVLIMSYSTYLIAKKIRTGDLKRKLFFRTGIILTLITFFSYKILEDYVFHNSATFINNGFDLSKWIILGIGYYTLQHISYLIDVNKGQVVAEKSFINFFLSSSSLFKLVSGPVVKPNKFIESLEFSYKSFNKDLFNSGIQRILLGLFKKLVIADRLSVFVSQNFTHYQELAGWDVLVLIISFTIQLYFDFSGYIDIAVGSARLFGINLPENFNMPFRSKSIAEFWRRWHITLINWLTQYIYYPVNFRYRKYGRIAAFLSIFITFLISWLWHGIGITYFLWATCHILYLSFELIIRNWRISFENKFLNKLKNTFSMILVLLLVSFSHLFFRSPNITTAKTTLYSLFNADNFFPYIDNLKVWLINGGGDIELIFNFRFGLLLAFIYLIFEKKILTLVESRKINYWFIVVSIFLILTLGIFDSASRFIYMQF